jgi:CheY-like chemotaxis protein
MITILVVEDDDDVRDTLEGALTARGHRVLVARNGAHALDVIRAHGARPSVIVLDLMMPRMNGEEFLAAAAAEPLLAHVPVILDTAQLAVPDPLPAVVKAVLWKPMKLGDLLLAIDRCVLDSPTLPPPLAHGTGVLPPITVPAVIATDEVALVDPAPPEHVPQLRRRPTEPPE